MPYSYRELIAWQKGVEFVVALYRATATFPKEEIYGLTSQLRRAAVSVPSNIAEGQGRLTEGEFKHFLGQARGSLWELQTQIEIAYRLQFLSAAQYEVIHKMADELGKILNGLIGSDLSRGGKKPPTPPATNN
ncbi:MAG: four helix bundle protein [Acidobacteriia bacterium]|nr:four helix bundle protein [Terriglobia bacterium]